MFYSVEKVLNVICKVADNRIKNNKSGYSRTVILQAG